MTVPPASLTPLPPSPCVFSSGMLVRFPIDLLGSLANALDNIRGVTSRRILVTVTGIVRPMTPYVALPPTHFPLQSQVNETAVMRLDYQDATLGTCKETVEGGNHFRYWVQSGDSANRYCFCLSPSASLDVLIPFFPSKAGPFSWPFHTNFRNNVSMSFISPPLCITLTLRCQKVGHDVIYNGYGPSPF